MEDISRRLKKLETSGHQKKHYNNKQQTTRRRDNTTENIFFFPNANARPFAPRMAANNNSNENNEQDVVTTQVAYQIPARPLRRRTRRKTVPHSQRLLVQQIQAYFHRNCAINDKSMKFGTVLEYISLISFSYRAISKSLPVRNGGHFSKWLPLNIDRRQIFF